MADLARLSQPMTAHEELRGIVVVDEIQHRPDLFQVLRVLADRKPLRAFLFSVVHLPIFWGTPPSRSPVASKSFRWEVSVSTKLERRHVPQLGINIPAPALLRFWTMVAHCHANIWNAADPARSLGIGESTVRRAEARPLSPNGHRLILSQANQVLVFM
jgi:uncharacterized protein